MTVMKQGTQVEVELRLPIQRLWEALRNLDRVAPQVVPNLSYNVLEGDGGVGSIYLVQFGDGRYEKEMMDVVDDRTHTMVSTVVAGGTENVYYQYQKTVALSSGRNGTTTIACWRAEYAPVAETSPCGLARDNALAFFIALEAFLTSNKTYTRS